MSELIYNGPDFCGVDEAGRGPLAGPVFAAAVILPNGIDIKGLDDSKKISEKNREYLFDIIKDIAVDYAISNATVEEINEYNILNATFLAMRRAVSSLKIVPKVILVDGNRDPKFEFATDCIIKGDSKYASIAAASILAKVARDRYMLEMAKIYPEYGFDKHKGYGTQIHYNALKQFGPSPIHRTLFIRKLH